MMNYFKDFQLIVFLVNAHTEVETRISDNYKKGKKKVTKNDQ